MQTAERIFSRRRGDIVIPRKEIGKDDPMLDPVKEFGAWLLWTGLSPESKNPVSRIGIYTDFT